MTYPTPLDTAAHAATMAYMKAQREYVNTLNSPTQEDADASARRASLAASAAQRHAAQVETIADPHQDSPRAQEGKAHAIANAASAATMAKWAQILAADPTKRAAEAAEARTNAEAAYHRAIELMNSYPGLPDYPTAAELAAYTAHRTAAEAARLDAGNTWYMTTYAPDHPRGNATMTTQAPTEATLDRIERMTPHQIAQEYTGRAIIARAAAVTHLDTVRAESARSGDYAACHALVTADAYARRAETYAREAITAADYGAKFETMTDEARAQLHTAANFANSASAYADAARAIAQSVKLAAKARTYGDITQ